MLLKDLLHLESILFFSLTTLGFDSFPFLLLLLFLKLLLSLLFS